MNQCANNEVLYRNLLPTATIRLTTYSNVNIQLLTNSSLNSEEQLWCPVILHANDKQCIRCDYNMQGGMYEMNTNWDTSIVYPSTWSIWMDYSSIITNKDGTTKCIWPKNHLSHTIDIAQQSLDHTTKKIANLMIASGFVDNIWHAAQVLNSWCETRRANVSYAVQTHNTELPKYMYTWSSAMGISSERIINHKMPIVANNIVSTSTLFADWSCLHSVLRIPRIQNKIIIYARNNGHKSRAFSTENAQQLQLKIKRKISTHEIVIFDGKDSFDDAREKFASAQLVIGPHGAGMVNVVFCQPRTHIIELLQLSSEGFRSHQMYGGGRLGHIWWPMLTTSFNSETFWDNISHVAETAIQSSMNNELC